MKETENRREIENLIRRFREQGDQAAFEELLSIYDPMLRSLVGRYTVSVEVCNVDDFRQTANIAFHNALQSYDLTQCEVNFGLYAKICIGNALVSYLNSEIKSSNGVDLVDTPADEGFCDDPATNLVEEEAARLLLSRFRKLLSPYEYKICCLHMAGYSAKRIAEMLGQEHHSIENAIYRSRIKLAQGLKQEW